MLDKQTILKTFSKQERYMAFLVACLPRLAPVTLYSFGDNQTVQRKDVMEATLEFIKDREGLCLEFGVYKGGSINFCAKRFPQFHFYGFDSFEGFPEDGRRDWDQDFSLADMPNVLANCTLIKGWFSETLPSFLQQHPGDINFLNIDCDLYSSTRDVFVCLQEARRLKPGIVVFFDEILNYKRFMWNEFLAFFEVLEMTGLGFSWLCAHKQVRLVDEAISLLSREQYPSWKKDVEDGFRQQASLVLTDAGIDYGPLDIVWYSSKIRRLAEQFSTLGF